MTWEHVLMILTICGAVAATGVFMSFTIGFIVDDLHYWHRRQELRPSVVEWQRGYSEGLAAGIRVGKLEAKVTKCDADS